MEGVHQIEEDKTSLSLFITGFLTGRIASHLQPGGRGSMFRFFLFFLFVFFLSQLHACKWGLNLTLLCEVAYGSGLKAGRVVFKSQQTFLVASALQSFGGNTHHQLCMIVDIFKNALCLVLQLINKNPCTQRR